MATKKIKIIDSLVQTDVTLTQSGVAADAKAVGDAITEVDVGLDKGSAEGSVQTSESNTLSPYSFALGTQNVSGSKGYYVWKLDPTNLTITLVRTEGEAQNTEVEPAAFETGYAVRDKITLNCDYEYIDCSMITEISGNVIKVDSLPPYYSENNGTNYNQWSDKDTLFVNNTIYCTDKPEAGLTDVGICAYSEGVSNQSIGWASHAEGSRNIAKGANSHAEGAENSAEYCAHAEGRGNQALGLYSHVEGRKTEALGDTAHAEGLETHACGANSHAEGNGSVAEKPNSHAEGCNTIANGWESHAEGYLSRAEGEGSHAEGWGTIARGISSHTEGRETAASEDYSHAEGHYTQATGKYSHAEGRGTITEGESSHAEGTQTTAQGKNSHTEGYQTQAVEENSHAEGYYTAASGLHSHAEGENSIAEGDSSHAEGRYSHAIGNYSHTEGRGTIAIGEGSHAEGFVTIAKEQYQHVEGKYNADESTALHIVGCGTSETDRVNCFTAGVDNGNKYIKVGSTQLTEPKLAEILNSTSNNEITTLFFTEDQQPGQDTVVLLLDAETDVTDIISYKPDCLEAMRAWNGDLGTAPHFRAVWKRGVVSYTNEEVLPLVNAVGKWADFATLTLYFANKDYKLTLTYQYDTNNYTDLLSATALLTKEISADNVEADLISDVNAMIDEAKETMSNTLSSEISNLAESKQDKITGFVGQFVVIGSDGMPTTKSITIVEEVAF